MRRPTVYAEWVEIDGADFICYMEPTDETPPARSILESLAGFVDYLDADARSKSLRAMPYQEYLKTDHWKATRKAAVMRAGRRCHRCGSMGLLNVHHRTYERLGREDDADLEVLCRECHENEHGIAEGARG